MCKMLVWILCLSSYYGVAQIKPVEQWGRAEIVLSGPSAGNPFTDVHLAAEFNKGDQRIKANGFYDGNGFYKIRFMPPETGVWTYRTKSNRKARLTRID